MQIGLSICYDVRFPELYRYLSSNGAELIMIPAAFTAFTEKITGKFSYKQERLRIQHMWLPLPKQGFIMEEGKAMAMPW